MPRTGKPQASHHPPLAIDDYNKAGSRLGVALKAAHRSARSGPKVQTRASGVKVANEQPAPSSDHTGRNTSGNPSKGKWRKQPHGSKKYDTWDTDETATPPQSSEMYGVNTPSKISIDSLDREDASVKGNKDLMDSTDEVLAGGSDRNGDEVVDDTGLADKNSLEPDNSDGEGLAEDKGISILSDEVARSSRMEEEGLEIAPRSDDGDSPGNNYSSCTGEPEETNDNPRVLSREKPMPKISGLFSRTTSSRGSSSLPSRRMSLPPGVGNQEGFSTPDAIGFAASKGKRPSFIKAEAPDALSCWSLTKQAAKRKADGGGASAAGPTRHELRFPGKPHVEKLSKSCKSAYPGLSVYRKRENQMALASRGDDDDDEGVREEFSRRIGATDKRQLEEVLKMIMKSTSSSAGAKEKDSKTTGSRAEHGAIAAYLAPLSWGFVGNKSISASSNIYVAVAHKLSLTFSMTMSDRDFVAWLRKAIAPSRSKMMTAGRQAVSALVVTLIDRVKEIAFDLEMSPSDVPAIMDELWNEVLTALLQLQDTDEALRSFCDKLFAFLVKAHRGRRRGTDNPLSLEDILGETDLLDDLRRTVVVPIVLNGVSCMRDRPVSLFPPDPFEECKKQAEEWVPVPIGGFPSAISLEAVYRDGMWKSLFRFVLGKNRPAHILNDMQPWEVTEATAREVLMPYCVE